MPLVHVDVYRLDHLQELHDVGFDELVGGDAVTVVEWGDRVERDAARRAARRADHAPVTTTTTALVTFDARRVARGRCVATRSPRSSTTLAGSAPDVLILAIDTATSRVSVAIGDGGAVIGEVHLAGGRRHAEQLAPAIQYLCRELDVSLDQLAAIAVDVGPGLFTGLRVGVTTAKVMAQALRIPVVGVPSLDLVAYPLAPLQPPRRRGARRPPPRGVLRVVPAGAGRRAARVRLRRCGTPAELVVELECRHRRAAARRRRRRRLPRRVRRRSIAPSSRASSHEARARPRWSSSRPRASSARSSKPQSEIRPLYLRTSDAEINWDREPAGWTVAMAALPEDVDRTGADPADAAPARALGAQDRAAGVPAPVERVALPLGARAALHARVLRRARRSRARRLRGPDDDARRRSRHHDRGRSAVAPRTRSARACCSCSRARRSRGARRASRSKCACRTAARRSSTGSSASVRSVCARTTTKRSTRTRS